MDVDADVDTVPDGELELEPAPSRKGFGPGGTWSHCLQNGAALGLGSPTIDAVAAVAVAWDDALDDALDEKVRLTGAVELTDAKGDEDEATGRASALNAHARSSSTDRAARIVAAREEGVCARARVPSSRGALRARAQAPRTRRPRVADVKNNPDPPHARTDQTQ